MRKGQRKAHIEWYRRDRPRYEALAEMVASTVQSLLTNARIDFLSVTHRAKTLESFSEKIGRKRYRDPRIEMTDLAGVRVITYVERDVKRACQLIETAFNVHADQSLDKTEELAVDRFGYKSVHFVCDIGKERSSLPEFVAYSGITFELQVRTALQHTWAEVEHDRNYKYGGTLPSQLKRRLYLVAGLLELADREFNSLTEEIEAYTSTVESSTRAGDLNVEINSPSVAQFLSTHLESLASDLEIDSKFVDEDVISELKRFGINSLADLAALFEAALIEQWKNARIPLTYIGILRDAMMYKDVDLYFNRAWMKSWTGWDADTLRLLNARYDVQKVQDIMNRYELEVEEDEWGGEGDEEP